MLPNDNAAIPAGATNTTTPECCRFFAYAGEVEQGPYVYGHHPNCNAVVDRADRWRAHVIALVKDRAATASRVTELEAALAAANARAASASAELRDLQYRVDEAHDRVIRERDALRADLARVTGERDEARVAALTARVAHAEPHVPPCNLPNACATHGQCWNHSTDNALREALQAALPYVEDAANVELPHTPAWSCVRGEAWSGYCDSTCTIAREARDVLEQARAALGSGGPAAPTRCADRHGAPVCAGCDASVCRDPEVVTPEQATAELRRDGVDVEAFVARGLGDIALRKAMRDYARTRAAYRAADEALPPDVGATGVSGYRPGHPVHELFRLRNSFSDATDALERIVKEQAIALFAEIK